MNIINIMLLNFIILRLSCQMEIVILHYIFGVKMKKIQ